MTDEPADEGKKTSEEKTAEEAEEPAECEPAEEAEEAAEYEPPEEAAEPAECEPAEEAEEPADAAPETPNEEEGDAEDSEIETGETGEFEDEPGCETGEEFAEEPEESLPETYPCGISEGVSVSKEIKKGFEDMKLGEMEAAVEAVLFAAGEAVEISSIAAVIGEDKATAQSLAESLIIKYSAEKRGINIIRINDSYQMCTNRQFYNYIDRLFRQPKKKNLSTAILEVLAIIAYKQPVTKNEIEEIRGVNSDRAVNKLVEYDLVCEAGRKKAPGRPILFATTDEFLRAFGYSSADALPELKAPDVEAFDEAAREVSARLEKSEEKPHKL